MNSKSIARFLLLFFLFTSLFSTGVAAPDPAWGDNPIESLLKIVGLEGFFGSYLGDLSRIAECEQDDKDSLWLSPQCYQGLKDAFGVIAFKGAFALLYFILTFFFGKKMVFKGDEHQRLNTSFAVVFGLLGGAGTPVWVMLAVTSGISAFFTAALLAVVAIYVHKYWLEENESLGLRAFGRFIMSFCFLGLGHISMVIITTYPSINVMGLLIFPVYIFIILAIFFMGYGVRDFVYMFKSDGTISGGEEKIAEDKREAEIKKERKKQHGDTIGASDGTFNKNFCKSISGSMVKLQTELNELQRAYGAYLSATTVSGRKAAFASAPNGISHVMHAIEQSFGRLNADINDIHANPPHDDWGKTGLGVLGKNAASRARYIKRVMANLPPNFFSRRHAHAISNLYAHIHGNLANGDQPVNHPGGGAPLGPGQMDAEFIHQALANITALRSLLHTIGEYK